MKFNLKNRPKWDHNLSIGENRAKLEPWFEGFEKELRQKLRDATKEWNDLGLIGADLRRDLLREILGES